MNTKSWFMIDNAGEIDTPALILYPGRISKNIKLLKTFVPDPHLLRPHVKTHKCPEVVRLMLEAGIVKYKCSTLAEAEMLAMQGAPDILLAYQPVGPRAERLLMLQRHFPGSSFSCLIDNLETAQHLSQAARKKNQTIKVFLDLNVGMNRTGIIPGPAAFEVYQKILTSLDGLDIGGLHVYDGHLRDPDLEVRTVKCNETFLPVRKLQEDLLNSTDRDVTIIAGGSPTLPIHAQRKDVECSPGTFIFWDKGYEQILGEQPFYFAAVMLTRIISRPTDDLVCIDLGHKAIASENPLDKRACFLNAPSVTPVSHSEEHMVLNAGKDHSFQVGDILYAVPYHVCPTVALHDFAYACVDNQVKESWSITARKRKITL